jgi:hypothetical protein
MMQLYSQPNNMHALDDLVAANEQDAVPAPFRKLREHRQEKAKLSPDVQADMRKKAVAGLKAMRHTQKPE